LLLVLAVLVEYKILMEQTDRIQAFGQHHHFLLFGQQVAAAVDGIKIMVYLVVQEVVVHIQMEALLVREHLVHLDKVMREVMV
jgi:hypothetical protein